VIAVEPEDSNFALLERNLAPYAGEFQAIKGAIWPKTENLIIKRQPIGNEVGHFVEPTTDVPSVRAVTIPELIAASGYERVSVLKIDIEGAERDLFSYNTDKWLSRIDNIVVELHGAECVKAFYRAVSNHKFQVTQYKELTIARRF
jgi:FkbM family methyltransferase